jgi:hypothetical protein
MSDPEATEFAAPKEEFVAAGLAFLALAISTLPHVEREIYLSEIERGDLREAVRRFEPCHPPGDRWVQ